MKKKSKIYLIMKLSTVFIVVFTLNLSATGFGQFSFIAEGKKVREVFDIIEKSSNYRFFYNDEFESVNKVVDLNVENQNINQVLDNILASSDYTYKVFENNLIVISLKDNIREKSDFLQNIIKGTVTDEKGNPLTGVTVVVKGTTRGTTTDINGNYSIEAENAQSNLVFSFIGFKNQEVIVGNRTQINITLLEEVVGLDEVVVIGYGTQSRATITTSVSKLDTKVLENTALSNTASALQGTIPGLRVINTSGSPGSSLSILLRGGASITSPGSPLVLVDGIVRSINDVNPADIESVQVLKDAASTAIYGARANNGVILLTTKKGKTGTSELTYKYKFGMNHERNLYNYLDARDYLWYQYFGAKNTSNAWIKGGLTPLMTENQIGWGVQNPGMFDVAQITNANRSQFQTLVSQGWEWMINPLNDNDTLIFKDHSGVVQALAFRNRTFTHDHYLNLTGGNDRGKFAASIGYYTEDGVVITTKYERFSGMLNGSYKVRNNVEAFGAVTFSDSKQPPMIYTSEANVFYIMKNLYPTFRPYDDDGNPGTGRGVNYGNAEYWRDKYVRKNDTRRTTMNLGINWDIIPELSLKAEGNIYLYDYRYESYDKKFKIQTAALPDVTRAASASTSNQVQQQHNITLNYKKSLNNHNINILLGGEYFNNYSFTLSAAGRKAATDDIYTLNSATERTSINSSVSEFRMISGFSRLNYDFNGKYLFTAVMRYDGISTLQDNRWGAFPGISAGWNLHQEEFFKDSQLSKYLSVLKPRISYGVNGNVAGVGNYEVQGVYSLTTPYLTQAGFLNTGVVNTGLRWEKTKSFDIGMDIGIINNKVTLVIDYFRRVTSDLLTSLPLPEHTGFSSFRTNLGSLLNYGFETDINFNVFQTGYGLTWDIGFNASFVKNKILKLPYNGNEKNRQGGLEVYDPKSGKVIWVGGYQEGESMGDMYGYQQLRILKDWDDVNQNVANRYDKIAELYGPALYATLTNKLGKYPIEPGDVLWADLDKNDTIDSRDRVKMGNIYPKWTGGFSTRIGYKNVSLSARFSYALGHTIYNHLVAESIGQYSGTLNNIDWVKDMWRPDNQDTDLPMFYYADLPKLNIKRQALHNATLDNHSSRFYYRGDYLSLNEITLSYIFPKSLISKLKIASVQANITGQNLAYFTKYPAATPEVGGVDSGIYPLPITVIFGLQVSF